MCWLQSKLGAHRRSIARQAYHVKVEVREAESRQEDREALEMAEMMDQWIFGRMDLAGRSAS